MSGGQAHTDIPIVVTTGGDALERHTAAMALWDHANEFMAERKCAHSVNDIRWQYGQIVLQFDGVEGLRRALKGTGVTLTSRLSESSMFYRADYDGLILVALSSKAEGSEVL